MAKKKNARSMLNSVNSKFVNAKLKQCSAEMDQIKKLLGKSGDGANGSTATLYGCVEALSNDLNGTSDLNTMYDVFNSLHLSNIYSGLKKIDDYLDALDILS